MKEKIVIYIWKLKIYIYNIKFNDFKERVVIVNYLVYEIYVNEMCCRFYYD